MCLQEFDMFCLQSLAVSVTHSSDLDQTMHRISVVAIISYNHRRCLKLYGLGEISDGKWLAI